MSASSYDIAVANLCKTFFVPEREPGLWSSIKSLVRRKTRAVRAVDAITFDIAPGEMVGFLGPNGAGRILLRHRIVALWPPGSTVTHATLGTKHC